MMADEERDINQADERASEQLNARFRGPLISFFRKRASPGEDVEDLVQEVFVRLARANIASVDRLDGYIFVTAANVLRDRFRRASVRGGDAHDSYDERLHGLEDEITPERVLLGKAQLQCVIAALEELPARRRRIFLMRRFDGMRHCEIAKIEGMSESGVRKHVMKAIAFLAERLEGIQ